MSILNNSLLLGADAGGGAGYQISRSLRFNSSDSAFLSRVPSTAGNRKTWTWAGWVKRSGLSTFQYIWGNANSSAENGFMFRFDSGDVIRIADWTNTAVWQKITSQVFRDVSAWYHIVISYDTTNATAADRVRLYVNGTRVTAFSTSTDPTQNYDGYTNNTSPDSIGRWGGQADYYLNAYLADIHFIDGQALTPSSFTEVSATTGQLIPKAYTGSYGTNGFHLDFADNSAATAAALGKDTSGNSPANNWTPNNFSVTAGAGNDSVVDVPSSSGTDTGAGGEVRGNYCTLNPLANGGNTLSNGNLQAVGAVDKTTLATIGMSSGKWYCEVTVDNVGGSCAVGIAKGGIALSNWIGNSAEGWAYGMNGLKYTNNNGGLSYGNTYTTGDVIGVAFDADAGSLYFYKNGTVQNSGTAAFTGLTSGPYFFAFGSDAPSVTWNFGQRPFAYTAPSGFKALCDTNLSAPVVAKPSTAMDVKLYTGNGSTQNITGLGFSPDLVWIKQRDTVRDNQLQDTVRGVGKELQSNATNPEQSYGLVSSFNSDGFTVFTNGTYLASNQSGGSYAAWCWDAGSSTVTNTQGSITSQVRANASAGFSIVSYTAAYTGSARTVGHGLGVKPDLIILKNRNDGSANWRVYHSASGASLPLVLNSTAAASANIGIWNNTEPTSSVFTIGVNTDVGGNIGSGEGLIAYCFAPVSGYSSAFSFTGNGSTDGPMVWLGFRPRLILYKCSSAAYNWFLVDTARDTYNVAGLDLLPNSSAAESDDRPSLDILSNGFKVRNFYASQNGSGATFVGFAWAENPFAYARAR